MKRARTGAKRGLTCTVCKRTFSAPQTLVRHMRAVHWGERNFKCVTCGRACTTEGELKAHVMNVHMGVKE